MKKAILPALIILIAAQAPAYAINDKYRKQLEQSGCTQVSETQGCDIHKSKAENAKAGFTNPATDAPSTPTPTSGNGWPRAKPARPSPPSASMPRSKSGSTANGSMPSVPTARYSSARARSPSPFRGSAIAESGLLDGQRCRD